MDAAINSAANVGGQSVIGAAPNTSQLTSIARVLIIFSLLIIFMPITMYFTAKSLVFEGLFLMSSRQSYIYSAILAVVTVHVILAAFLFMAFYEGGRTVYDSYKKD